MLPHISSEVTVNTKLEFKFKLGWPQKKNIYDMVYMRYGQKTLKAVRDYEKNSNSLQQSIIGYWIPTEMPACASVNSSSAHLPPPPPPPPSDNPGKLLTFSVPAVGLGICLPWGDPRAFETSVTSAKEEFIAKDKAFVEDWLVREGLSKLVDICKGMFKKLTKSTEKSCCYFRLF